MGLTMSSLKQTAMLLLTGICAVVAAPGLRAQSAWLSTPESIEAFRQQVEAMKPVKSNFEPVSVVDRKISLGDRQIKVRIYDPGGDAPQPALVYVHGGCWVAGSLESHDEVSRYMAVRGGAIVVAIDYRLAPEHPFPAAHEDVFDTVGWVWDHADELGVDRERLALGGESAGAHLAAATAVRLMDESEASSLAFLLLVYAALDGGGSSWAECKNHYFETAEDVRSRYGSPLWLEDLAEMPKTFSVFGEHEPSRAEQELFVRKLREHGVPVRSFMNPGVGHDVENWLAVSGDLTAHEVAIEYLREGFALGR
ncbi:MAG: alpha/beta hydrolase [Acidobacteriota bacterium]